MAEEKPVTRVEIPAHALGIDDEAGHDPTKSVEHVVEREERVGNDDSFRRRLRDVAFMPERHVLEPDDGVRTNDAREPADALRDLRVALVRHRGRPLHAVHERLLDLAHLRTREMTDL